jgi:hypothetical protein
MRGFRKSDERKHPFRVYKYFLGRFFKISNSCPSRGKFCICLAFLTGMVEIEQLEGVEIGTNCDDGVYKCSFQSNPSIYKTDVSFSISISYAYVLVV